VQKLWKVIFKVDGLGIAHPQLIYLIANGRKIYIVQNTYPDKTCPFHRVNTRKHALWNWSRLVLYR